MRKGVKKMNIDFYIDKIYVINKPEPETKDNSKPKSKLNKLLPKILLKFFENIPIYSK
jgi:division protein CdvB (Snf7/Vps24/ESCRT-III family)